MKIVTGTYSSAKIFTDNVEEYTLAQIQMICDNEAAKDSQICVMPDVHPGKVGPVGLSMTIGKRVLPNLIGVDMGCGMSMIQIKDRRVEWQKLDTAIRGKIPAGFEIRNKPHQLGSESDFSQLLCERHINEEKAACSIGTLGGGNHFIEVDVDEDGKLYVIVHSGSRHLGAEVTEYYLREGQRFLKEQGFQVPYEMTWLEGELMAAYLHDLRIVQEYAALNREVILKELEKAMKWKVLDFQSCVHNYIAKDYDIVSDNDLAPGKRIATGEASSDGKNMILRKGAISAKKDEKVIIPINMRDGIILGKGLGNAEWNCSAPHGSGRLLKRSEVEKQYTVSDFKKSMKGIYCNCIGKDTLDEAPFVYRGFEEIRNAIAETVEIQKIIRPVYNFKAGNRKGGD